MKQFQASISIVCTYAIGVEAESFAEAQTIAEHMTPEEIKARGVLEDTLVIDLGKM